MQTSYLAEDVTVLLKDVSGLIAPQATEVREEKIQSGVHYSEMLPLEYQPSAAYMALYQEALANNGLLTAYAIKEVAEKIWRVKGAQVVLVSLARAGTPVGILIKHYLSKTYGVNVPHYTISIIRGRGIDRQAMSYLLAHHQAQNLQFIDGWTGKGAILQELQLDLAKYPGVSDQLAVLADPAGITNLWGTQVDFLVPSACLNATVSGLMSRTILNSQLIGATDFHGAVYYDQLVEQDQSYAFIHRIEQMLAQLDGYQPPKHPSPKISGMAEVRHVAGHFAIGDINLVKPGIGETTRVLLRRVPWKILVAQDDDGHDLEHIYRLAKEKNVQVIKYPLQVYRACGLIKNLSADA